MRRETAFWQKVKKIRSFHLSYTNSIMATCTKWRHNFRSHPRSLLVRT